MRRTFISCFLPLLSSSALALGGEGLAAGFAQLGFLVLLVAAFGVAALVALVRQGNGKGLLAAFAGGALAYIVLPGACSGQPEGYECPAPAVFFAFVILFGGGTCITAAFAWVIAKARQKSSQGDT